ncbi:hypothetical protein FHU38_004652 [Saccharomonospora amisosensis]|uniref:Uncharacterized protein n=1 Tax=Saccharomonospora amisosensis TaxID=1128677 RepID=A0A7X5UV70_9PSEU|nr:hypothetical protein [Saccharomonospora amisosensis]NIJ14308.1 hypothetical protein [Saccharomonospora amisosensis]
MSPLLTCGVLAGMGSVGGGQVLLGLPQPVLRLFDRGRIAVGAGGVEVFAGTFDLLAGGTEGAGAGCAATWAAAAPVSG